MNYLDYDQQPNHAGSGSASAMEDTVSYIFPRNHQIAFRLCNNMSSFPFLLLADFHNDTGKSLIDCEFTLS